MFYTPLGSLTSLWWLTEDGVVTRIFMNDNDDDDNTGDSYNNNHRTCDTELNAAKHTTY